eukprot:scaffold265903_cov31-Tisochrysis_lutea.AAC.3
MARFTWRLALAALHHELIHKKIRWGRRRSVAFYPCPYLLRPTNQSAQFLALSAHLSQGGPSSPQCRQCLARLDVSVAMPPTDFDIAPIVHPGLDRGATQRAHSRQEKARRQLGATHEQRRLSVASPRHLGRLAAAMPSVAECFVQASPSWTRSAGRR